MGKDWAQEFWEVAESAGDGKGGNDGRVVEIPWTRGWRSGIRWLEDTPEEEEVGAEIV